MQKSVEYSKSSTAAQAKTPLSVYPLILLVRLYQTTISPLFSGSCRFHPSCSQYAIEALRAHGMWRGLWLSCKRIGRCHPWHPGGYDPVPGRKSD